MEYPNLINWAKHSHDIKTILTNLSRMEFPYLINWAKHSHDIKTILTNLSRMEFPYLINWASWYFFFIKISIEHSVNKQ